MIGSTLREAEALSTAEWLAKKLGVPMKRGTATTQWIFRNRRLGGRADEEEEGDEDEMDRDSDSDGGSEGKRSS